MLLMVAVPAVAETAPAGMVAEQGGIVRAQAPQPGGKLTLDGKPVPMTPAGDYIIGFGRDAPASATLVWTPPGAAALVRTPPGAAALMRTPPGAAAVQTWPVTVTPRQWRTQNLPTLPLRPVPDAEFEARRPGELAKVAAARAEVSTLPYWRQSFIAPAKGPVTGVFGSQRIYAGTPSAPHAGLDIGAAAGAPVVAPAAGVVRLAEGPFTLEGNLVMIDHGFGLVSAFLHLSRIDVKPGDVVKQGQQIGAVGRTGRATGPHLHWGVSWTDVRVDPAGLLKTGKHDDGR